MLIAEGAIVTLTELWSERCAERRITETGTGEEAKRRVHEAGTIPNHLSTAIR